MDVVAQAHGFCNPDELAYCPALVEVATYYPDENCWMPEMACDHLLRLEEWFDPRPDVGYNLPLESEIEVYDPELPF